MTIGRTVRMLAGLCLVMGVLAIGVVWHNWGDTWGNLWEDTQRNAPTAALSPSDKTAQIERGQYLARAGNCVACHSARGSAPMAGGRRIDTPFGAVYSSNLTPDPATGIGHWSPQDFWQALHHGRSRDGRLLAPAFPYNHTSVITRSDSDDLLAWLQRALRFGLVGRLSSIWALTWASCRPRA